jgi:hypothetical protein
MDVTNILQSSGKEVPLIHEELKKKKGSKYTNSGTLHFDGITIQKRHSFLDYIRGGYSFPLTVGIDFTSSNGDPNNPTSLHYHAQGSQNHYEKAIRAVCEVVERFNDQYHALYGYVLHCVFLIIDLVEKYKIKCHIVSR